MPTRDNLKKSFADSHAVRPGSVGAAEGQAREQAMPADAAVMPIRVSIVEDNARFRGGLEKLIQSSPGFQCASLHASAESAIADMPAVQPDVVLMDVNLPGMNGVECVRQLRPLLPGAQIMMLTVYENTELIFQALSAGATGYLLKQTPPADLLAAIGDVHEGGSPMSSHIARKIVQSFQKPALAAREPTEILSPREAEVLDLLAKGYLYKEIAEKTGLTYATVHTHIRHIYEKLHVRSRGQAVAKHLGQAQALDGPEAPRTSAMVPRL